MYASSVPTPRKFLMNPYSFNFIFDDQTSVRMAWGVEAAAEVGQTVEVLVNSSVTSAVLGHGQSHPHCSPVQVAQILAEAAGLKIKSPQEAQALRDMWICSGLITHVLLLAKENGTISENSFKACVDAVRLAAKAGDPLPS